MRSFIVSRTALCALLVAAVCIGCSPVAWAPRETPHTSSIDLGNEVTLLLRDGSIHSGTYAAVRDLSDAEYETYYASGTSERSGRGALPSLGQMVTYTTSLDESRVWKGELVGFDESSLLLADPGSNKTERVYISSLGSISGREGRRIRRMSLRGMYMNGEIPLRTAVVIASDGGSMRIPLSEIQKIRLSAPGDDAGTSAAWLDARDVRWASR